MSVHFSLDAESGELLSSRFNDVSLVSVRETSSNAIELLFAFGDETVAKIVAKGEFVMVWCAGSIFPNTLNCVAVDDGPGFLRMYRYLDDMNLKSITATLSGYPPLDWVLILSMAMGDELLVFGQGKAEECIDIQVIKGT